MLLGAQRERSGSELVFGVLKTLMIGYQLWGAASGLELSALCSSLHTTNTGLGSVLAYLAAEGLVHFDDAAGTVCLSDLGARKLLGTGLTE
ncbi:MAG: hypothetical protein ACE5I7_10705 [Candidatus Binatia bacterium]